MHSTLLFISGTSFSNRMPWISNLEKMESDMSRKSNNKGEIVHLIMKWRRKKNWNTMHSSMFHIGIEWYFVMWMSTSAYYTMQWVTNAIITVSLCITCSQLSFPSHTLIAQLNWTDLNCISIGSHEQRYQHGTHGLR